MKQGGAVLAKGRLLGLQFETLFTDGLYYKICRHGVELALQIKAAVQERGLGSCFDLRPGLCDRFHNKPAVHHFPAGNVRRTE